MAENETGTAEKPEVLTLKSGKVAEITPGKGKHVRAAQRLVSGNPDESAYFPALMSQIVTIDGKPITMEDVDELPMGDYMQLMTYFTEHNFL